MYPILVLKPQREKSILQQHPWIFSGAVLTMPDAKTGDIIEIRDSKKSFLGFGFFNDETQIIAKLFYFGKEPIELNENFWFHKIKNAFDLRQKFIINQNTNAYRLLHAEGDFLPSIIADVYNDVIVVQILSQGIEQIFPHIQKSFEKLGFKYIYLKNKDTQKWLTSPYPSNIIWIKENNLEFSIDFEKSQKTGFFLDQRENRSLLQQYSEGKSVLNTFAYTGGFSVYALAGGAEKVISADISKEAIENCEKIIDKNFKNTKKHSVHIGDCFDYLKNSNEEFDIIVLDPPAFAKSKQAVKRAARGYISLNELAIRKIKKGGLIFTFSCSGHIDKDLFRKMVFAAAAEVRRPVRVLHQLTQPLDHPINIYHPEGEYLKGLVLCVD
ncbi:MAG: class I SAM-dependent rRNA methyltransferase [Bacteroidetes bacterium]|nr:MAG: class I SAM-dependent rRNA methyltransferase [Bacteroidota bacterium]TAG86366.1 MAG: class I SAM-dependent rRNA methyltransferase [Bacteroidota bacterium]